MDVAVLSPEVAMPFQEIPRSFVGSGLSKQQLCEMLVYSMAGLISPQTQSEATGRELTHTTGVKRSRPIRSALCSEQTAP
jgi:hypothetical protein